MNHFRIAAAYVLIAILGSAYAATVSVYPGSSIQAAIYTAKSGDIIEVHSGVYYEHVNVNRRITLRGIGMPILDATASGSLSPSRQMESSSWGSGLSTPANGRETDQKKQE